MSQVLAVGLGGFFGSILRFLLTGLLNGSPLGTLLVNLLGAFSIGVVIGLVPKENVAAYAFLVIGVLGGFTTFSAVSLESLRMISDRDHLSLFLYLFLTIFGGIALCFLGSRITS